MLLINLKMKKISEEIKTSYYSATYVVRRVTAQVVSLWPPTAKVRIQSQTRPHGPVVDETAIEQICNQPRILPVGINPPSSMHIFSSPTVDDAQSQQTNHATLLLKTPILLTCI
jgi:hypothetical protein